MADRSGDDKDHDDNAISPSAGACETERVVESSTRLTPVLLPRGLEAPPAKTGARTTGVR